MNAFLETNRQTSLRELRERCEKVLVECETSGMAPEVLRRLQLGLNSFLLALPRKDPTINRMARGLQALLNAILDYRMLMSVELSDALLLTLDRMEASVEQGLQTMPLAMMMDNLRAGELMEALSVAEPARQADWLRELTELLAPEVSGEEDPSRHSLTRILEICAEFELPADTDLLFFATLAPPAEARLRRWQGRHARLLKLGLAMNREAASAQLAAPVDAPQLAAALLVHDISMAFMPLDLLEGQARLSRHEEHRIHTHAGISGCLLQNLPHWSEARQMIEQHHEWVNGRGYPMGLQEHQIHEGAKIIAIVDTFEAITHPPRFKDHGKRPYLRAAMEINNHAGTQFSPPWVGVFNRALKSLRGDLW